MAASGFRLRVNLLHSAKPFCAAAALSLLLGGCAAGTSLAARGAIGAVTRTAAVRMGASRVLVSDPLLGVAARRGVLQETLYNLTAGGTRVAELTIERGGLIRAGGQPLAILESSGGQIVRSGRVHGALEMGRFTSFWAAARKWQSARFVVSSPVVA